MTLDSDCEFSGRASLPFHRDDFVTELLLHRCEMRVLVKQARSHPDAYEIGVPWTEAEPAAHLEQCVVRVARTQEVGDDEAFECQTTRERSAAHGDDCLRG